VKPLVSAHPTPRLSTLRQVRREAARLYGDARQGRVPAADASRLASVLALIATILRDADLEARVERLEAGHAP
jgi:hypothetical protein